MTSASGSDAAGRASAIQVRVDLVRKIATTTSHNGSVLATAPWPLDPFEEGSALVSISYDFGGRVLSFETRQGDRIEVDLPNAGDLEPVAGRPIIYLDQNHWSTLFKAVHAPESVPKAERRAAERLRSIARDRDVIVPMSAAHVSETCQWSNAKRRYRLAITILDLSHGWQLRDVLVLRRAELQRALSEFFSKPGVVAGPSAVTLEPGAIFDGRTDTYRPDPRLGPELSFAATAVTETSVIFDLLLADQPLQPLDVPGWSQRLQRITVGLRPVRDANVRRRATLSAYRADVLHEVLDAGRRLGLSNAQSEAWIAQLDEVQVSELPSLGLYRELLHEKLLDPATVWEQNDLVDMMYLTSGAAYTDHVVGERRLTGDLRQALRRLGRPTNVHRNLTDLTDALGTAV